MDGDGGEVRQVAQLREIAIPGEQPIRKELQERVMRYAGQVPGRLEAVPIAQADMLDTMLSKLNVGEVRLRQDLYAQRG